MSTHLEIDLMIAQLDEMLPEWAGFYPEPQFIRMLAEALDFIAASADSDARMYCVMRTGHLNVCSVHSSAFRDHSCTLPSATVARMRYPSHLISCTHCAPWGGASPSLANCGSNGPDGAAAFFALLSARAFLAQFFRRVRVGGTTVSFFFAVFPAPARFRSSGGRYSDIRQQIVCLDIAGKFIVVLEQQPLWLARRLAGTDQMPSTLELGAEQLEA